MWNAQRCIELRICGSRRVARHDRWAWERAVTRFPALVLVGGPLVTAPLKRAHWARGALQSVFMGTMRTQNLDWLERFSLARCYQFCQAPVGSLFGRCHKPGERAGGRAGEERLCSSSKCRASRAKLQCQGVFFFGWLAKFLGRLHACVKFRGWSDVAPRVQRQRRTS